MRRMTTVLIALTALSAPAFAETPVQREMHSFDFVSQVGNHQAPAEVPPMQQPMEHHDTYSHPEMKHNARHMHKNHDMHHHTHHAHKSAKKMHKKKHHHMTNKKSSTAPAKTDQNKTTDTQGQK